jgi:hypothetical protein
MIWEKFVQKGSRPHLLAQSVTYDAGLLERGVFIEGVRKDIIRDIVAKVSYE